MNYSRAIFLISDEVRAIMVAYEPKDKNGKWPDKPKLFKTFNQDISVDDYVVVPTTSRHNMTVCQVAEVDVDPDFESNADCNWIVGVVDRADFEAIERQEQAAIDAIKTAERRKKRDELRKALMEGHEEIVKEAAKQLPGYAAPETADGV